MHKHIYSFCLGQGRFLGHAEKDCIFSKRQNAKKKKTITGCPSNKKGRGSVDGNDKVHDILSCKQADNMSKCVKNSTADHLFIYLFGVLRRFQHCTGHITTGSWKGRGNQYIQFVRVLYCKLPTNGKQLPAFPLEAVPGTEPRLQRWEVKVLPLCHRGPTLQIITRQKSYWDKVKVDLQFKFCLMLVANHKKVL